MLDRIPELLNADEGFVRRGRFMSTRFLVEVGDKAYSVAVDQGRVSVEEGPFLLRSHAFTISADAGDWERHWADPPPPGWQDLFAMTKDNRARVEGDLLPFMQNLQYVKDLLAAPRRLGGRADHD